MSLQIAVRYLRNRCVIPLEPGAVGDRLPFGKASAAEHSLWAVLAVVIAHLALILPTSAQPAAGHGRVGSIGSGWFEWLGDDGFGAWAITGNPTHPVGRQPGTFAAQWTEADGRTRARVLGRQSAYGLPCASRMESGFAFPLAAVRYLDEDVPVSVSLRAFAPLIPGDIVGSTMPVALFVFTVRNVSRGPARSAVVLSLQSVLGMGGAPGLGAHADRTGVSATVQPASGGMAGVAFQGPRLEDRAVRDLRIHNARGSLALMARYPTPEAHVSACSWNGRDPSPAWWAGFARDGTVSGEVGVGVEGATHPTGAVAIRADLRPNETREFAFAVAWHCPRAYEAAPTLPSPDAGDGRVGADRSEIVAPYVARFRDAAAVARFALDDLNALATLTEEWQVRLGRSAAGRAALPGLASELQAAVTSTQWRAPLGEGGDAASIVVGDSGAESRGGLEVAGDSHASAPARLRIQQPLLALFPAVDADDIERRLAVAVRSNGTDETNGTDVAGVVRLAAAHVLWTRNRAWLTGLWPRLRDSARDLIGSAGSVPVSREAIAALLDLATHANDTATAEECAKALGRHVGDGQSRERLATGAWSAWAAMLGCVYDPEASQLTLAPSAEPTASRLSGPAFMAGCWAWCEWRQLPARTIAEFRLDRLLGAGGGRSDAGGAGVLAMPRRGPFLVGRVVLRPARRTRHANLRVLVGSSPTACAATYDADGRIVAVFDPPLTIGPGDRLTFEAVRAASP